MPGDVAADQFADDVVTNAEGGRKDESTDADGDPSERGPPHPVQRCMFECVFNLVDGGTQDGRENSSQQPHQRATCKHTGTDKWIVQPGGKYRTQPQQMPARGCGNGTRQCNRDQTTRLPLK